MAVFDPDNIVWRPIGKFGDVVFLSLFWLVCSLPLVTLGPASAALYRAVVQCVRGDRKDSWALFFHTFRENLKVGCLATLAVLAAGAALFFLHGTAYQMASADEGWYLFYLCYTFLLLLPLGLAGYLFPTLSQFTFGVGGLLSNCAKLALVHPLTTLALGLELWAAAEVTLRVPYLAAFFLPALTALFQSLFLERIFRPYIQAQREADRGEP